MADLAEQLFLLLLKNELDTYTARHAQWSTSSALRVSSPPPTVDSQRCMEQAFEIEEAFRTRRAEFAREKHGPLPEPGSQPRPEPTTVPSSGVRRG